MKITSGNFNAIVTITGTRLKTARFVHVVTAAEVLAGTFTITTGVPMSGFCSLLAAVQIYAAATEQTPLGNTSIDITYHPFTPNIVVGDTGLWSANDIINILMVYT